MLTIEKVVTDFLKLYLEDFDLPLKLESSDSLSLEDYHLTSDVIIRYARQVKKHPDQLSLLLSPKLSNLSNEFKIHIDAGYLNIEIREFTPQMLSDFNLLPPIKILFPLSATGQDDAIFLRLLSLAISQLIFSKGQASLMLFTKDASQEYFNVTDPLLNEKPKSLGANLRQSFLNFLPALKESKGVYSTLWLSPDLLSKSEVSKLYRESVASKFALQIQIPHASWLKDLDPEIVLQYRESSSNDNQLRLNLLLSSSGPSAELYYDEAVLPGRNNLLWYLETTKDRLVNLGIKPHQWGLSFSTNSIPNNLQKLVWSILLLPAEQQKAVVNGSLSLFFAKIYNFLDRFNQFFNSPQLRHKIINNNCSQLELEILSSGLGLVVDKILEISSATTNLKMELPKKN